MSTVLRWRGAEVYERAKHATKQGINETLADCVNDAKDTHPWSNRTGTLEGSLQMRPAVDEGSRVVGTWGSFTVRYAIYLELGTRHMHAMPYLRPAADRNYPKLKGRIQAAFR